ncbi:MAG TPA: DNA polymerase III subunit delta [Gaiellaceae bacterium]|jgi:DNA polymerase-3 subunit delta
MAADPLLPVYLLTGTDRPKIRRALLRLRSRLGEEAVQVIDASQTSGEEATAACNELGLFGGEANRLVVVEGVERWKEQDVDALAAYAENPAPGAVLVLVAEEALKNTSLMDICTKSGRVLAYDLPKPRDLGGWVREQFSRVETAADPDAARALVEIVGEDPAALTSEIEKLATWSTGATITLADVEALAVPAHEQPGWAVTDAWGARDVGALLQACETELERNTEPFLLAARLGSQVALVRAVRAHAEDGLAAKEIAKRVRRHEFRVRKALAHADNYTPEELDAATVRLAELDAALKGASRLAAELELERALVELVAVPEHPAATAARS